MKLIKYNSFEVTISSEKGNFIQEIDIKASSIEEALAVGEQFAESVEGEVSGIIKSYKTHIEPSTRTITINI